MIDVAEVATNEIEFVRFLKNKVANEPDAYHWLKPILASTLDQEVHEFLTKDPPRSGVYYPNSLFEQLQTITELLDLCLAQRQSIHSLETTGIMSALDIEHALKTNYLNNTIERQQIRYYSLSTEATASGEVSEAESALAERTQAIEKSLKRKLALHGKPGSALNYGERVGLVRSLYRENIRSCYERADAVWKGMCCVYCAKLPRPPTSNQVDNHTLALIAWTRICLDIVDRAKHSQRRITKSMRMAADPTAPTYTGDVQAMLGTDENVNFKFPIYASHFLNFDDALSHSLVLQELNVAWLFEDNFQEAKELITEAANAPVDQTKQAHLSAYRSADDLASSIRSKIMSTILLTPPEQHINLDELSPLEKRWTPEPICIYDVSAWTRAPTPELGRDVDPSSLHCTATGIWEVSIPKTVSIGSQDVLRSQLPSLVPQLAGTPAKTITLAGLMITFGLAVIKVTEPDKRLLREFNEMLK